VSDPTPTGSISSLRSRLQGLFGKTGPYAEELNDILRTAKANHPKADLTILERAFEVAEEAHRGQLRKSGEEYITHPLAVTKILADLGIGVTSLAAALLHDTVEDTPYTLDQLTRDFGAEIAMLVDGVTKLDKVKFGENAQAETVRKMVVAMSKDIRVLVIKLADRLHNARTWKFVPEDKARKKAQETLEIYAPLAHRLGISAIKSELEDISFGVLYPKVYEEIVNLVRQRSPKREEFIEQVIGSIEEDLRENRIRGRVAGRPKQYYSIYQKMVLRGREFDDIYDLVGIRVIVQEVRDCYAILGSIHARWSPVPGRFKDYIAMPKFNLYQSLHTTVIGPAGRSIEIQIRTQEMHQRAEYGVAAHWKYKESVKGNSSAEEDLAWLKHLSDWQAETQDPGEFLDALRFEIGAKDVYVFTPKGRVIGLPSGATPVDFAYAVHTEVGHRTMGAKVNGRLVPLETALQSGDVVEIFTSKSPEAGPSQDWLNFVKSQRAKAKIKQWVAAGRRDDAIESGKDLLAKALRKANLPLKSLLAGDLLIQLASEMHYADVSALYAAIGEGHVSAQSIVEKLTAAMHVEQEVEDSVFELPSPKTSATSNRNNSGVLVRGDGDVMVKLARCCTPVPGDDIVGWVTRGTGVSVHRSDCKNVEDLKAQPERLIDVAWAATPVNRSVFLVQIQIEALDRNGLLSDVTRVLSEHHVNILSASVSTRADRVALSRFVFEIGDPAILDHLLSAVRRIDAVYDVYRVQQ
jgi:guanosine-3',5'-bis(diphosphate) 3'-pyrophosphohydrolase